MTTNAVIFDQLEALRRGDLAGARELRLVGGLTEFPQDIFGLADTLEVLDLSGGTLTALPDDLGRLTKLRVLFCSGNRFERLPSALGDCAALSQIGFRGTGLREVPDEALPPLLRWLTLTDNQIVHLPDALGDRPLLQKLMLAGNRLRTLPASLANAESLELIRLAANAFDALPGWLPSLPRLAWVSFAGNPFGHDITPVDTATIPWAHLEPGELLGEGASGRIYRTLWRRDGTEPARPAALKLFKGAMTSDGLPECEMAACLAAGGHPNLTGALGRMTGHPEGAHGLLMPLLDERWRVLAGPPSLESCSRDVYDPGLCLDPVVARRIAHGAAEACAHLHAERLLHGDLYGHNVVWDGVAGNAVLGDFGAASPLSDGEDGLALQRIEVRAWGILLGELLSRCPEESADTRALRDLEHACVQADPRARPVMVEICAALPRLRPGDCRSGIQSRERSSGPDIEK